MFGQMGQLMSLMGKTGKIKEEFEKLVERLGKKTVEGQAGGGMVTVTMTGKFTVQSCRVSDEALALKDKEMLEDLIAAATNQALEKAKNLLGDEARKSAAEVGLPLGFAIPGLG
jgi:DNA-binding YbaB/EbfC family protein